VRASAVDTKLYIFSNRFKFFGDPESRQFFIGNDLSFPPDFSKYRVDGLSKEHRILFGPIFVSRSYMYTTDNDGLRGAVRRLTCVREPDTRGLHKRLMRSQFRIRSYLGRYLSDYIVSFRFKMRNILNGVEETSYELRTAWCEKAHPKKRLRYMARDELVLGGTDRGTRVDIVDYKCKPGELLAAGKYLRAVGDLTCPGSTVLGYFMDFVKEAFSIPYSLNGCNTRFIKSPQHDTLVSTFSNLMNPELVEIIFFSDDSCVSIRCRDGRIFVCNMDISACDGSNFDPVFLILEEMMNEDSRYARDVRRAFKQCRLPCKIRSSNGKFKIKLKPKYYTLYSGSILTTSINNVANTLISLCVFKSVLERGPPSYEDAPQLIRDAAATAGYLVKIDQCNKPEDIQFLKISPTYVNGDLRIFVNLGAVLRGLGHTKSELEFGKKSLEYRCAMHTSGVVKSFKHIGQHCVWDALQHLIIDDDHVVNDFDTFWRNIDSSTYIPDEALLSRYGIEDYELSHFCERVRSSGLYSVLHCPVLDKIYAKDYGYQ